MADLFDIVVARKLSGGGSGGGGSSDFSTAEVTIVSASEQDHVDNLICAMIDDDRLTTYNSPGVGTHITPLYKGQVEYSYVGLNPRSVQVSGDASMDYDEGTISITGDCTITIP